ncbi:hypothetical protein [Streptomyces sp. NBC_01408]|uniref:hypothetical protein n=1 Tax=Streptomyces sp. NBC_01408 TaxID=2903855 RepID=UPI00225AE9F8|nr:hypothetical protein [Streptomyces sp. NBC_01408]MCX4692630.1 hypothetical protein [Streptomyces sp. NBC_01408]
MTIRMVHDPTRELPEMTARLAPVPKLAPVPGPSQDLLDRARVGWERFIDSVDTPSDE